MGATSRDDPRAAGAAGPCGSFDEFVVEYEPRVRAACRSILRDEALCADAVQETFLRAWRTGGAQSQTEPATAAWLRKVAVSACLDLLRRRRSHDAAVLRAGPRGTASAAVADPAFGAADAELRARYRQALGKLSDRQRAVFVLRHEGGMTLAQVADFLGVALPTAKTQFARACLNLQASLSAFRPEQE